jgi:penicillin-binding protein 2
VHPSRKNKEIEGFYVQKRSLRDYEVDYAANVFGYITQVNEKLIAKNPYYNSGDLIGVKVLNKVTKKFYAE